MRGSRCGPSLRVKRFGRRVFSILDTEAIPGEEQGKVLFVGLGFPGEQRNESI